METSQSPVLIMEYCLLQMAMEMFYYNIKQKMSEQINFKLTELELGCCENFRDLDYSFTVSQSNNGSINLSKTKGSDATRVTKFSRKNSREKVEIFREKIRSNTSSTKAKRTKMGTLPLTLSSKCNKPSANPFKKCFNDLYNMEHRQQQIKPNYVFSAALNEENSMRGKIREYKQLKQQKKMKGKLNRTEQQQSIKYLPMFDVLNYNGENLSNPKVIERRLRNKVQKALSHY